MSTIAAISSPLGAGGIGIVRVSGNEALKIADAVFHFKNIEKSGGKNVWEPLKMHFGVFNAEDFSDKGYAVFFPADRSFTGQDTVEFYLHGGVRIMQGALEAVLEKGATAADKGEFTKRAYLNGRMSLADAEGVIDMINAESAAAVRAAYRLMDGGVSAKIDAVTDKLLVLISTLEATLDYPDEMEDEVLPEIPTEIDWITAEIDKLIVSSKTGRMAKHGITAVLAGKTNSGKSSLMNAVLQRERAIVTDIAGTTRDTVSESFECDGVKINLVDTAGIRESDDVVEKEGIARARRAYDGADVILHIIDSTEEGVTYTDDFGETRVFTVLNKCDKTSFACPRRADTFAVSAKTGENVGMLTKCIAALYSDGKVDGGEIITSERHLSALYRAKNAMLNAVSAQNDTLDCLLIDLREAYSALGEITGKTATEDIVNSIFSKFCVGK